MFRERNKEYHRNSLGKIQNLINLITSMIIQKLYKILKLKLIEVKITIKILKLKYKIL